MAHLSERGASNVNSFMGGIPPSLLELSDETGVIDLSFAENYVIRNEVLAIMRTALSKENSMKDLNWPHGFWGETRLLGALSSLINTYFRPAKVVSKDHIVLTSGAAGSLDALAWSICDPGEGILIPCPYHGGAYDIFLNVHTGAVPVPIDVDSLGTALGQGLVSVLEEGLKTAPVPIKGLLLTNPHNPLGRCYDRDALIELLQFCERNDLHLISDEVFALSEHGCADLRAPRRFTSALSIDAAAVGCSPNRVHAIWSVSKDLSATGARLACIVTQNKALRDSVALVAHTGVSNLSILFCRELLESPKLHDIIQLNSTRLAVAYARMTSFFGRTGIEYLPCEATTFVLARLAPLAAGQEDEKAALEHYKQSGILLFSASDYRMPQGYRGWMRVSFAVEPERLEVAMERLRLAYERYLEMQQHQ